MKFREALENFLSSKYVYVIVSSFSYLSNFYVVQIKESLRETACTKIGHAFMPRKFIEQ